MVCLDGVVCRELTFGNFSNGVLQSAEDASRCSE